MCSTVNRKDHIIHGDLHTHVVVHPHRSAISAYSITPVTRYRTVRFFSLYRINFSMHRRVDDPFGIPSPVKTYGIFLLIPFVYVMTCLTLCPGLISRDSTCSLLAGMLLQIMGVIGSGLKHNCHSAVKILPATMFFINFNPRKSECKSIGISIFSKLGSIYISGNYLSQFFNR